MSKKLQTLKELLEISNPQETVISKLYDEMECLVCKGYGIKGTYLLEGKQYDAPCENCDAWGCLYKRKTPIEKGKINPFS